MQLTDGICTLQRVRNISEPGEEPVIELEPYAQQWFGILDIVIQNSPETPAQGTQAETRRIRIHRNDELKIGHVIDISEVAYKVTRIFSGTDDDSGERICDVTLEAVSYGSII